MASEDSSQAYSPSLPDVIRSRLNRRRRVSSLIPPTLITSPRPATKSFLKTVPRTHRTASQIKIKAIESRPPQVQDETNTYPYPVIVVWRGKYFPVFPGSVQGGRLQNGRMVAAKLNEPLLGSALWAKRPLWEMYESIKEVLSVGWDYANQEDEYVLNIWGYHEGTTSKTTLDDVCKKYFSTLPDGGRRRGPLVLGFRPYAWVKRD